MAVGENEFKEGEEERITKKTDEKTDINREQ